METYPLVTNPFIKSKIMD